jgi:hypothetical protein
LQILSVVYSCNPNYLGGGGRRIINSRPAEGRGEVKETPSQPITWVLWCMSLISAMQEMIGRKIMIQAGTKTEKSYLKNK